MGSNSKLAVVALCSLFAACSGGGGGAAGAGNSAESTFGVVRLLDHSPADDDVQVALDAVIVLEFDADMALESFGDEDTWLRKADSTTNVPGTFARGSNGRVSFQPSGPLDAESDYVFQLSPLTSDQTGRILDVSTTFTFRTFDNTPPHVVSVDVQNGSTGQSRTRTFTVTFDERLGASSVTASTCYLRDVFFVRYPAALTIAGNTVTIDPYADLPGDRLFSLVLTTQLADRAGNHLENAALTSFTTATDGLQPHVVTAWPQQNGTGISPLVQPTFAFDESMDPATVEAASLLFQDQYGSVVPFAIEATKDQRTLRLRPTMTLLPNRHYTLAFLLGAVAATDVSGNSLAATQALTFTTGTDVQAPTISSSVPSSGETRVPGTAVLTVTFSEPLDPAWVTTGNVTLTAGGQDWTAVVESTTADTIRVTPVLSLPTNAACVLTLRGGQTGLHDVAGNVLALDATIPFTTSADAGQPAALVMPPEGATGVAPGAHVTVVFDAPMDPATLTSSTVQVTDDFQVPLPGTLVLSAANRVATFTPSTPLSTLTFYRVRILGGSDGPRRLTGNWFANDQTARFRTGLEADHISPQVTASINRIDPSRREGLTVPPTGFTIEVEANDLGNQNVDMGSIEILLAGAGSAPSPESLLAAATIDYGSLQVRVPSETPLSAGSWTLTVRAHDLAGNVGTAASIPFTVQNPTASMLPFERTQVIWVRSDLDRDNNGRPDFDDDMQRLGFATVGDPAGTNSYVRRLVLDAILAKANSMYGRGARGEPLDGGSVGLRFSVREPIAVAHTQMALGGFDPEGDHSRGYGNESTGVLGRAYYDYRNGNPAERNTALSPGLGIFPGEMWLYQTHIHVQVYPSYLTQFAQRFRPLCPDMGGTPAGSHALDAQVLTPSFDYASAGTSARARWQTIMDAADDWASVIGIILAHEVGHSVGLVAPGAMPTGLFGDSSLHDTYAGATEVMAPSVGYEAMTTLDYAFRDIDLAYLRQRVLLQ